MLYSVESQTVVDRMPYQRQLGRWMIRLTSGEKEAIERSLRAHIADGQLAMGGVIPGINWEGAPFAPIWRVCKQTTITANLCVALWVYDMMLRDEAWWGFRENENEGESLESLTYFRLDSPPV